MGSLAPAPAHHTRGVVTMLVSAAFFVGNILLVRALSHVETVNIWLTTCTRFVVGIALVYALYPRELQFTRLFTQRRLIVRGVVGGATVYAYYLTVVHLGAGRATFINNTYVIFGALLAVVILRERFGAALAIGSAAALGGLALLTNLFATEARLTGYDVLGIVTAFGSAYVVVTIRQLHQTEHTSTIFAAQCVYGLLLCAVPAVLHPSEPSALAWGMMVGAGLCAAAGQIAMTHAFRDLPVAEGSLLQMLTPLGIAVGGALFFAERFSPLELTGAALILGGTAFTALRR